jgi:hypothetical protein
MSKLSKINNGGREMGKRARPRLKKGRGIYTSSQNVTVAVLWGADNLAQIGADNLAPG